MATSFPIHDYERLHQHIKSGMKKAVRRGLLSAAYRVVQDIQVRIIPAEDPPPIDRRIYAAGWQVDPNDPISVYNDIPYGTIIEHGARAENIKIGREMIEALTQWVMRKGLAGPRPRSQSKRGEFEVQARNIAWAIAVSMKTKGIFNRNGQKGLRIGEKAKQNVPQFVREEIAHEMKRMGE